MKTVGYFNQVLYYVLENVYIWNPVKAAIRRDKLHICNIFSRRLQVNANYYRMCVNQHHAPLI